MLAILGIFMLPLNALADGLSSRLSHSFAASRDRLATQGLALEGVYSGEFVHNFDAGLNSLRKETVYQDNLDLTLTLDTQQAGLWPGGTFFLYGLFNHGSFPSANVIGDLQTVSNIEASRNQFIVNEAWYEQRFSDDDVSLLLGLHDLNSEFYVSEYGSLFFNSSFGIGPEVSANVPTSIFPKVAFGVRLNISSADTWYMRAAVYDGNPETRSFSTSEGAMFIGETGRHVGKGIIKAGYWLHTADKTFAGQKFSHDYGIYGITEYELFTLEEGGALGGFVQFGWVPGKRNDITRYFGAGLHLSGMVPMRENDEQGIAIANATTRAGVEHSIEATWRVVLTDWLAVQPSMQWIINPGGNRIAPSIRVGLLRFEVTL